MALQETISCLWKHPEALQFFTELMSSQPLGFSLDNQGLQTWTIKYILDINMILRWNRHMIPWYMLIHIHTIYVNIYIYIHTCIWIYIYICMYFGCLSISIDR
jgi:hypothetical protein